MAALSLDELDSKAVESFRCQSPHASAFNTPEALEVLGRRVEWYAVRRGGKCLIAWPLVIDLDGNTCKPLFHYYLGPMLHGDLVAERPHRRLVFLKEGMELLIDEIASKHRSFGACLPLGMTDVRPLRWAAESLGVALTINPRYTATIEGISKSSIDSVISTFARSRRRAMATSTRIDVQRSDVCLDELIALYRTVHERQGKDAGVERERQLMGMAMLCRSDGLLMGYRSCSEDRLVGLTMLLTAGDRVNNILTMSAPSTRELGLTSRITADALRWSAEQGYEIFDFNGANTFSRAVDKALYHAEEKLYFRFDIEHQTSPRTYL